MGGSENKHCTVLSWADEAEKEEEEAKAQLDQKQTQNPFGSARPREIVLQERGIDWRKLDKDLQQQRSRISLGPKESIQAPVELSTEKKPMIPRSNVPQFPLNPLNHMPGILVPQLKYPPRIVPANLFRSTFGSHNFQSRGTGPQNFHCKSLIEPEKENTYYELRMEQFSTALKSHIHHYDCYIDQQKVGRERGSNRRELRKSSTHEERRTSVIGNKRWLSVDQRVWKKTRGDYGRDGVMDGLMNSPPIETIENRQRKRGHQDSSKNGGSHQRYSNGRMVRSTADDVNWKNIKYEDEWQSSPGKVAGCPMDAVANSGRAKPSQKMRFKRENSGENYGQSDRKRR
ncbi:hypothetical protein F0562_000790 [Nyssa sinensis]|uniref:Uncharacterized protein n=1 Tax=Nyssa sinensis TaxID=561372 RepID=A0A5J5C2J3_9ASTE|nr:hypothetical protein F0562_000790 [Nyssa sinensis]